MIPQSSEQTRAASPHLHASVPWREEGGGALAATGSRSAALPAAFQATVICPSPCNVGERSRGGREAEVIGACSLQEPGEQGTSYSLLRGKTSLKGWHTLNLLFWGAEIKCS